MRIANVITLLFLTAVVFAGSCQTRDSRTASEAVIPPNASPEVISVQLMRQYCGACHALGQDRFIGSQDDMAVWRFILENRTRNGEPWARRIVATLSWPSDQPPPPEARTHDGRRWMPVGFKRIQLANGIIENEASRQLILSPLSEALARDHLDQ